MDFLLRLKNSKLVKDNLVLLIGTMGANTLGFVFHFYAGRKLGPENYAVFGALLAILYYFVLLLFTFQTGVAKFVSEFKVNNRIECLSFLLKNGLKKVVLYGLLITFVFLLFVPLLSDFLGIPKSLFYLLSGFVVFSLFLALIRGILQGLQKFKVLGYNLWCEGLTKVVFVVILLGLGFGVSGALFSMVLAWIIPGFLGLYLLRKSLKQEGEKFDFGSVYKYVLPLLFMMIMLTAFYTLDVLLVKHYFGVVDAGLYAGLSLVSKILFFGSISISQVMFPKIVEVCDDVKKCKALLFKSLGMVFGIVSVGVVFYFLFGEFVVTLVLGENFLGLVPYLGWFGVFMALFSLVYLLSFYNIALNRFNFVFLLGLFVIIEGVLLVNYHSSLMQVVMVLVYLMIVLLILMLLYTLRSFKNESKCCVSSL